VRAISKALVWLCAWLSIGVHAAPTIGYTVVARYAHPDAPFTQGFELHGDTVYESSGLYDQSFIARWQLQQHQLQQRQVLPCRCFGEGLTVFGDRIYVLTWREQKGFVFDKNSLQQISEFPYRGEGWGLTHNDQQLIASDGSATLRFLDPQTLRASAQLNVVDNGQPIAALNELEWLPATKQRPARILANIWQTDTIIAIDPVSGNVTAQLDLGKLYPRGQRSPHADVLNGIAYDARDNTLLLTGKIWPFVYRVKLIQPLP